MPQNRNERLAADFADMLTIQDRPYLSWIATKGELPYAQEYLLTIKLRTYVLSLIQGRYTVGAVDRCTVRVTLWDSYPATEPYVKMLDIPPVFHPNWYSKGTYSPSVPWRPDTSLKEYIKEMLRTLRYDPEPIETERPANYKALDWYIRRKNDDSLFPCDRTELTENNAEETAAAEKAVLSLGEVIDSWQAGGRRADE